MDAGRLVVVVSDRDVRLDIGSVRDAINNGTAAHLADDRRAADEIMSRPVHIIDMDDPLERPHASMLSRRISALPVVDADNRLRGMITTTDCLASLAPTVGIDSVGGAS